MQTCLGFFARLRSRNRPVSDSFAFTPGPPCAQTRDLRRFPNNAESLDTNHMRKYQFLGLPHASSAGGFSSTRREAMRLSDFRPPSNAAHHAELLDTNHLCKYKFLGLSQPSSAGSSAGSFSSTLQQAMRLSDARPLTNEAQHRRLLGTSATAAALLPAPSAASSSSMNLSVRSSKSFGLPSKFDTYTARSQAKLEARREAEARYRAEAPSAIRPRRVTDDEEDRILW